MQRARPQRARALLACLGLFTTLTVAGCTGASAGPPSMASVTALLAGHSAAVTAHDQRAFATGLSSAHASAAFRKRQLAVFANLRALPLSSWSYRVAGRTDDRGSERTATKRYGADAIIVRLTLRYGLTGVDPQPTSHDLWWTFVRRGGRTVIAGDDDLRSGGGTSWQGPWDFGALDVVRDGGSLIIGHPTDASLLKTVAGIVRAAVPAVTAVWGTQWTRRVAVLVPSTPAELKAELGEANSQAGSVVALAVSDSVDPLTHAVLGQRLVVYPSTLGSLSALGAQIVIRHEMTHIAAARATTDISPRWLVEGFADYVGNLHSGQPVTEAATELRADVRAGRVPVGLPTDAQFDTTGGQAQAYEGAWLACRLIAAKAGQAGLVRFYRDVGAQPSDSDAAVAAGLRGVLHESTAAFTAQWRQYLRAQLGR